jgi:prepilin-type processing-associated H-X9-DG protein
MPAIYACPSGTLPPGETPYRVIAGPGTLFGAPEGIAIADIRNGTSNTLLVIEGQSGVPWTRPEDLSYDPAAPLPAFNSPHPGGWNGAMADGSVRFFKESPTQTQLQSGSAAGGAFAAPGRP